VSQATAATAKLIDDIPSYIGETMHGQGVLGQDTEFLAQRLLEVEVYSKGEPMPMQARHEFANFSRLTSALQKLLDYPESDEFGPIRPTKASVDCAIDTLFPLVQRGFSLPDAVDVGTDHDGALRIVWENGPRFLELVVPHERDAAPYFYYSHGSQYSIQSDLTPLALQQRFTWLASAS